LWQNAFDRDEFSDAAGTETSREIDFCHSAHGQLLEENVLAKGFEFIDIHTSSSEKMENALRIQRFRLPNPDCS